MRAVNLELKERQMLMLLAEGATTGVIAKKMGYGKGTVLVYLHHLYRKIGVTNRTEALIWHFEYGQGSAERAASAPIPRSQQSRAEETFGDVALRDGLLGALGIMESFTGPYGRVWEASARLKGAPLDEVTLAARDEARVLWRALLKEDFSYAKRLHDEGQADRWLQSAPAESALLVCALLLGGYSHADAYISKVSKVGKSAHAVSRRALSFVKALREAQCKSDDEAMAVLHQLAAERSREVTVKQLAIVALFYLYRQRKDPVLARGVANVLWSEAESARRTLEAAGIRPLMGEVSLARLARVAKAADA